MNEQSGPEHAPWAASDFVGEAVGDAVGDVAPGDGANAPLPGERIGAYLASHRRLRGISLADLARQTRIPLRSLELLEGGSFDGQSDGFVRGFVRTVALALGLDPKEAVARMQGEPGRELGRRPVPRLSLARVFLTLALLTSAFGLATFAADLLTRAPRGAAVPSEPLTVRRDPVRALAEAQGVMGLDERAAALAAVRRRPSQRTVPDAGTSLTQRSAPPRPLSRVR